MTARIYRLESYGVPFDIALELDSERLDARLRAALPPITKRRRMASASRRYRLFLEQRHGALVVDGSEPILYPDLRAAIDALEGDLALHVAASAPRCIFIHAGVVGWRGRALLLPGRTLTGKSTLVHALVRRGATYLSDEYAVVDAAGLVHPYARRMSLRRRTGSPRRLLPPRAGRHGLPAGWVLGSQYDTRRRLIEIEPLSAGRTALLLLDNAIAAQLAPARVLEAVRRVSEVARGGFLRRGEAGAAAKDLLPLLATQGMLVNNLR